MVVTCADCGKARDLDEEPHWHCLAGLEVEKARSATVEAVQRACAELTGGALAPNPKYGAPTPPSPLVTPILIQSYLNDAARLAMLPFRLSDQERASIQSEVIGSIRVNLWDRSVELSKLDEALEKIMGCRCQ